MRNEKHEEKKCYLCGWNKPPFKEINGKILCEQCYSGEVENPKHKVI